MTHSADEVQAQAIREVAAIKTQPELGDLALRDVNILRGMHGLPTIERLQCGVPHDSQSCPLAQSLSGRTQDGTVVRAIVGYVTVSLFAGDRGHALLGVYTLPAAMKQFSIAFDRGILPKYRQRRPSRANA